MSEHIAHIAVAEDSARLVQASPTMTEAFKTSLRRHPDIALMAASSRGNHHYAVPFLEKYRDLWPARRDGDGTEERIAAAIGWIAHRAADEQVKPLGDRFDEELEASPDLDLSKHELDVYQDAVVFREAYGGGRYPSISPLVALPTALLEAGMASHPGAAVVDVDATEPLFAAMIQRAMVELHTFAHGNIQAGATSDDLRSWVDTYLQRRQYYTEELSMYVEAYQRPDPWKMQRYIDNMNFYDARDPVIRLVRSIQHGRPDSSIDLEAALAEADRQSQYAQALRKSYLWLQAGSDFFEGRLDKTTVYDLYDIWEGHRT
jgi:hypothetical protein